MEESSERLSVLDLGRPSLGVLDWLGLRLVGSC